MVTIEQFTERVKKDLDEFKAWYKSNQEFYGKDERAESWPAENELADWFEQFENFVDFC